MFALLPMSAWFFKRLRLREKVTPGTGGRADDFEENSLERPYSAEEEDLHQLGIKLGEGLKNQTPSSTILKQVELALESQPARSAHLVKTGLVKAMCQGEPAICEANPMKEDVDRVLAQLGLSAEDLSTVAR